MDLFKVPLQYSVRHTSIRKFQVGEVVFLKSNPEWRMAVSKIEKELVSVTWKSKDGRVQIAKFPPECILQYKYAGLISWNSEHEISIN